jgi:hypothetical protein
VFRPADEVFNRDSLQTYAHRPVTMGHPEGYVTADTWKDSDSVGLTGEDVVRDGEFVRVPMVLMDKSAIEAVQDGDTDQLSMGYSMVLDEAASGDDYDATMRDIRSNHVAVVPLARGGSKLRIGDTGGTTVPEKTEKITVDGIEIEVVAPGQQVIERYLGRLESQVADAQTKISQATDAQRAAQESAKSEIDNRDTKIKALQKAVADAATDPKDMAEAVARFSKVRDQATRILGRDASLDGMSETDMYRTVVNQKMGEEVAKTMTDEQLEAAFEAFASIATTARPYGNTGGRSMQVDRVVHDASDNIRTKAQDDYLAEITGRHPSQQRQAAGA